MQTTPRVVAYVRMSSEKQDTSPERQLEQIAAHAKKSGYPIREVYRDLGIAGDDHSRPDFLRLLSDAQTGKFDVILIDEPSRLSRTKPLHFIGEVVYPLEKAQVAVESVSAGRLYWDDIAGLIMSAVLADRSRSEVKNLSRRVLDGMARSARAAWWNSVPPFGYLLKTKRDRLNPNKIISRGLVPGNAKHVAAVQWMFREYAKGRTSLWRIVKQFASWGILGRKRRGDKVARPYTPQAIWAMLRNSAYVGDTIWNKHSKGKYSKLIDGKAQFQPSPGKNPQADWIVVRGSHAALVKRSTFQAVQVQLQAIPKRAPRNHSKEFKLSKILVCGQCNDRMFGGYRTGKSGRVNKYGCGTYKEFGLSYCNHNSVAESTLITLIASAIQTTLLTPGNLKGLMEQQQNEKRPQKKIAKSAKKRMAQIPRQNLFTLAEPEVTASGGEELDTTTKMMAKLWKVLAVLEQGTAAQVRSVFAEVFDHIVLHFEQRFVSKLNRSRLRGGVIYVKLPEASHSTMPMLRLSFTT